MQIELTQKFSKFLYIGSLVVTNAVSIVLIAIPVSFETILLANAEWLQAVRSSFNWRLSVFHPTRRLPRQLLRVFDESPWLLEYHLEHASRYAFPKPVFFEYFNCSCNSCTSEPLLLFSQLEESRKIFNPHQQAWALTNIPNDNQDSSCNQSAYFRLDGIKKLL